MLAICIEKKRPLNEDYQDCVENENVSDQEDGIVENKSTSVQEPRKSFDAKRDSVLTPDNLPSSGTTRSNISTKPEDVVISADLRTSDGRRRGSAGVVGSMMLLKTYQNLLTPLTQDAPFMTEDMHEERLRAVEAFGDSFVQLEVRVRISLSPFGLESGCLLVSAILFKDSMFS